MTQFPLSGRIAGIDFGSVRIGIAVTDAEHRLASPFATYTRRDIQADARYFQRFVNEEQIVGFVVGLPLHISGDESRLSFEARTFGQWLNETTSLPIQFFDERFTSAEADTLLGEGKLTRKKRKKRRDMLAAQIMLAGYLESESKSEHPGALDD